MRLDRAVSVHLIRPFAQTWNRHGARIPILMYHSISDEIGARHPYYETNTSPRIFRQQMSFLHQNGYSAIGLEKAVNTLKGRAYDPKSVVITFDDGYRDFYTEALPILREYRMTATLFVVTGLTCNLRSRFKGKDCLTWAEVKELRLNEIEVGSHTETHPELNSMKPARIEDEVGRSKQTIEEKTGDPVHSFSYPYAFPESNHSLIAFLSQTLEKYGYENGVSTILGTAQRNSDRFFLPRVPVNTWDDLPFFQAKLEGAYNWLHAPQALAKFVKGFPRSHRTKCDLQGEAAQ